MTTEHKSEHLFFSVDLFFIKTINENKDSLKG